VVESSPRRTPVQVERSFDVDAPPKTIWQILMDTDRWPEWNASIEKVEWTRGDTIEEGNRVRITQPRLPTREWEVIEVEAGRYFAWRVVAFGVRTVGTHDVGPIDGGHSLVTLGILQTGFLAPIVARTYGAKIEGFLQMEGGGLAARAAGR
jgi:uncharacterized protein YndB with AHSA1/START domain